MDLKNNSNKDNIAKTIDICKHKMKQAVDFSAAHTKELQEKMMLCCGKAKASTTTLFHILSEKTAEGDKRAKVLKLGGGVAAGIAVCAAAFLLLQPTGYALQQGSKTLGYIQSPKALDQAVAAVEKKLEKEIGIDEIIFEDDDITCTATKDRNIKVLDEKGLQKLLADSNLMKANAWALSVDDKLVLAAATKADAQKILDGMAASYQAEGAQVLEVTYKENVGIAKKPVSVGDITSVEDGITLLLTGQKEPEAYTVQDGDTIWDIAVAHNLSPYELQEMNPGFVPEKMQIGQELNLVAIHPYLTVMTTELVTADQNVEYDTTYENTTSLYQGQSKVKTQGVYGVQKVTSQVVKENGVLLTASVVSTETVSQPQAEVVYKGTRSLSSFTGTGVLGKPVPVNVSSAFGSRGSGRHTGVDLRNPKGTAIHAADDGVVTFSGYSGSYGNLVKLSHGNGLETWYAHCDTLGVTVGQVVNKGHQIATVGITGRATGYHVHFEVRKNGVPQNPLNYL